VIHFALNHQQPWSAGNNFRQAADFLSPTGRNCRWFSANRLWICV